MKISALIASMLVGVSVFSQSYIQNLGMRVGYSQSTQSPDLFRFDQVSSWICNIHSVYFGADWKVKLNENIGVSLGSQLCQKGYKMSYNFYDPAISTETSYMYTLSYVDFPVNLIFHKKKYSFQVGLTGSYLLHGDWRYRQKQMYNGNQYVVTYTYANPITFSYNRYDYGVNLGISRNMTDYLDLEFNFLRGLTLPDKLPTGEIRYQESFLFGIKYYFLKNSHYLVGRTENK